MNALPTHTPEGELIFSVSELNNTARQILESNFGQIYVGGEISNLSQPASGHQYFSLKDARAQVRCALFRGKQTQRISLKDGMQVIVRAGASLYPDRGDYQLIIEQVIDAGHGILMQQFEALKQKLAAQGLFSATHKQPLPAHIQTIGVITSDTGAALQDILTVLKRRFPAMSVRVYASQVQGEQAPKQLINAIQYANQENSCNALILARGGGSLEDLWAFNDEALAHAIYNSTLPVISAVGHEIDFTIADFVADLRAPTPSAAAELVSPNQTTLKRALDDYGLRLQQALQQQLRHHHRQVEHLSKRLRHPRQILQDQAQRLDIAILRLNSLPERWFQKRKQQVAQLEGDLIFGIKTILSQQQQLLAKNAQLLDTLSPLSTLSRGYAIVQKQNLSIVSNANQVKPSELIEVTLSTGKLHCIVQ
jgi:exodeoxyribonuclease VII large subunit